MYSAFGIKKIGSHCITRYTAVDALRRFVFVCFVYTFPKKKKKGKAFCHHCGTWSESEERTVIRVLDLSKSVYSDTAVFKRGFKQCDIAGAQ